MALLYEDQSYQILGACFEVYKQVGCGFLEAVYQECLFHEFTERRIPFRPKVNLRLEYKGRQLAQTYEADFICYEKIILEIKSVTDLHDVFRAQVHNYLKATGLRLGFLANFGHHPKLEYERIIR